MLLRISAEVSKILATRRSSQDILNYSIASRKDLKSIDALLLINCQSCLKFTFMVEEEYRDQCNCEQELL